MNTIKTEIFTQQGRCSAAAGRKNGDTVRELDRGAYKIITMCDGAGQCSHGAEAAELVAVSVEIYLSDAFPRLLLEEELLVRREITLTVDQTIERAAGAYGIGRAEFGCTILAAAMDREGRFCFFHLGDGMIFGKLDETSDWISFSYPQRGLNGGTYLTGNDSIFDHIQFCRRADSGFSSICMFTDGFSELLNREPALLSHPERLTDAPETSDDCSAAWMSAGRSPWLGTVATEGIHI